VDTLMILTFTINKLTISQSLILCAFLISCDINYPGVQDLRIDVMIFLLLHKIHSIWKTKEHCFLVLTVTSSKLRNFLLIHWVKCLPIMVKHRKNNIVEHVMLLCHLITYKNSLPCRRVACFNRVWWGHNHD